MRTLANCTPLEFLTQTNKIRRQAEKWLSLTKILEIRKTMPKLSEGMTAEEMKAAWREQVQQNLSNMMTAILEEYPKETADLLCLVCFVDPADMENHSMTELLSALNEILANDEVISFFGSLARLGLINGSTVAEK